MKQLTLGVDIIEIERIGQAVSAWGERFLKRIYTEKEIKLYGGRVESLAARFAAKEAVFKALSPHQFFGWRSVEITSFENGRPRIELFGNALKIAEMRGIKSLELSLSHSRQNAVAVVIGFEE